MLWVWYVGRVREQLLIWKTLEYDGRILLGVANSGKFFAKDYITLRFRVVSHHGT